MMCCIDLTVITVDFKNNRLMYVIFYIENLNLLCIKNNLCYNRQQKNFYTNYTPASALPVCGKEAEAIETGSADH